MWRTVRNNGSIEFVAGDSEPPPTAVIGARGCELAAMAVQLIILFSYQAHVGFMFERVALLNGLFMSGLALGPGGVGSGPSLCDGVAPTLSFQGAASLAFQDTVQPIVLQRGCH